MSEIEPKIVTIFMGTGQGSALIDSLSAPGINPKVGEATLERIDSALSGERESARYLCTEARAEDLADNRNGQVNIYSGGAMAVESILDAQPDLKPDIVVGHSVGLLAMLLAIRSIDVETGGKLADERGYLMQNVANAIGQPTRTDAVKAKDAATVQDILDEHGRGQEKDGVIMAVFNDIDRFALSGLAADLDNVRDKGFRGRRYLDDLGIYVPVHHEYFMRTVGNVPADLAAFIAKASNSIVFSPFPENSVALDHKARFALDGNDVEREVPEQTAEVIHFSETRELVIDKALEGNTEDTPVIALVIEASPKPYLHLINKRPVQQKYGDSVVLASAEEARKYGRDIRAMLAAREAA